MQLVFLLLSQALKLTPLLLDLALLFRDLRCCSDWAVSCLCNWSPVSPPPTAPSAPPIAAPAPGLPTAAPMIAPVAAPKPPPASTPFSRVLSGCEQLASRTTAARRVVLRKRRLLVMAITRFSIVIVFLPLRLL